MSPRLRCRAQISAHCLDGQFVLAWKDDATFDHRLNSVVCDCCYVDVIDASPSGRGLAEEIAPTVARLRAARSAA